MEFNAEGADLSVRLDGMKFQALVLLFSSAFLSSQQPNATSVPSSSGQAVVDRQPDSNNDIDMENWINFGGKTVDRLMDLGVEKKIAESIQMFVKWQAIREVEGQRTALMFLPCHAGWDSAYLYVLSREKGTWLTTDHAEMDCHYDNDVSLEVNWIRDPGRDEILIHHACAGHGTGYLEQNLSVFTVSAEKLKSELETTEVLHSYPSAVDRPRDLDQNSTFTIIPMVGSGSRAIEETRSAVLNGKLSVRRRIFRWDPNKGKYVPSAFTLVEAAPN